MLEFEVRRFGFRSGGKKLCFPPVCLCCSCCNNFIIFVCPSVNVDSNEAKKYNCLNVFCTQLDHEMLLTITKLPVICTFCYCVFVPCVVLPHGQAGFMPQWLTDIFFLWEYISSA